MPRTQQAAIVLTYMHMLQMKTQKVDRPGNALLLDVRVKRVHRHADTWMPDVLAKFLGLGSRPQEERLRTVHRLDRNIDRILLDQVAHGLKHLNRPLPLVLGWPVPRKIADWREDRASQQMRSHLSGGLNTLYEMG